MKKFQLLRFLLAIIGFLVIFYFTTRSNSYYLPGRMAFINYCSAHSIDSSRYAWTDAKARMGYSYLDFAPDFGAGQAAYRVIIPWIGKPRVVDLHTENQHPKTPNTVKGYFSLQAPSSKMRRIDYIENKLGIQRYDFKFSIPRDKKLVAAFDLEVNGAPFPAGSGIYEVLPPEDEQAVEQWISIDFFAPTFPSSNTDPVTCDVNLDGRYNLSFLIPKADFTGHWNHVERNNTDTLEIGKNYEVWSYSVTDGDKEKLRFTLAIHVESVQPQDAIGKVVKKK